MSVEGLMLDVGMDLDAPKRGHVVYIVYVFAVENGEPNLYKVKEEFEFETEEKAKEFISEFNEFQRHWINEARKPEPVKAVYYGCVNDATGELV